MLLWTLSSSMAEPELLESFSEAPFNVIKHPNVFTLFYFYFFILLKYDIYLMLQLNFQFLHLKLKSYNFYFSCLAVQICPLN